MVSYDDYDPWGMQLEGRSVVNGSTDGRFKYKGKERDVESGYDYFGAKYYDARIGRFLSVDPHASNDVALSPFSYAGNNPLAYVDPTGMDSSATNYVPPTKDIVLTEINVIGVKPPTYNAALTAVGVFAFDDPEPYSTIAAATIVIGYNVYFLYQIYQWRNEGKSKPESNSEAVKPKEDTPKTHPEKFMNVRGSKAKVNIETGEVWDLDSFHKDHYEVYKIKKVFENNGPRDRDVWDDGRPKRTF